jgi:hypothetical protein
VTRPATSCPFSLFQHYTPICAAPKQGLLLSFAAIRNPAGPSFPAGHGPVPVRVSYQRRLRALIAELETLSQEIADNDPRWNRQAAKTNVARSA